ncbi:MAG TPA: universal stress protein [Burkholderiales bacterium]|nr:universal stress protein [Burkholderiales bacterium]
MPGFPILLPFDGGPAALRAAELLAGYAGDPAALSLALLNVQAQAPDAGRTLLKPALARLAAAGFAPQADVQVGPVAPSVLAKARSLEAELVVMGTRGEGTLQGFALGSVALRVVHGNGPPVLLVKPQDRLPGGLGRRLRVLLAMDGSPPALRAAERLAAWRAWLGELEVHLVYAQQPLTMLEAVLPPHDDVIGQWSTQEGEQAAQKARELFTREKIAHHLHLSVGDAALELRTLAEQTSSDLVVAGTRGLGAAHHALIGSVALKSAALSAVPVLLVP